MPEFDPYQWPATPADPNDLLLGQLISSPLAERQKRAPLCVIFGLPFDGAVLGRKGAKFGPSGIRAKAGSLKAHSFSQPDAPFLKGSTFVCDLGDARLPDDVEAAHGEAEGAARYVHDLNPNRAIALGGDHSLTCSCALPYLEQFGAGLAVVNLDAHLDVRGESLAIKSPRASVAARQDTKTTVSDLQVAVQNSGTSFRRLIEKGLKHYHVVGARDYQTSPEYVRWAESRGARIVPALEVFKRGAAETGKKLLRSLPKSCKAIYLSVDIDVADASVAPGVSAPTPGGLLAHQLLELVRVICADRRVVACDIMELAPPLEEPQSDRSARLAAAVLAEMLSVPLAGRGAKR